MEIKGKTLEVLKTIADWSALNDGFLPGSRDLAPDLGKGVSTYLAKLVKTGMIVKVGATANKRGATYGPTAKGVKCCGPAYVYAVRDIYDENGQRVEDDIEDDTKTVTTGFQFLIEKKDAHRSREWVRLMGSGGLMGDGCLYAFDDMPRERMKEVLRRLLVRARRELEKDGYVRVHKGEHLPCHKRIEKVPVVDVYEVQPLRP